MFDMFTSYVPSQQVSRKFKVGKKKHKTKDISIGEFGRLKAKMQSFIKKDEKGDKKPKGINKYVVKKTNHK